MIGQSELGEYALGELSLPSVTPSPAPPLRPPRHSKRKPDPYELYGLGFLYGVERLNRRRKNEE